MSRIGNKQIDIPAGVKIELNGSVVKVTGTKGDMQLECHPLIKVSVDDSQNKIVVVNEEPENRKGRQMHGTTRALIANMVTGVSKGFETKMEIYGTGYNVKEQGNKLIFQVGYSHPVEKTVPAEIKVVIDVPATRGNDVPAKFTLSSIDKAILGKLASDIRKIMPPEPYKGKGIRYADEQVIRKEGKAFASGGS
ncbi:MAG: 50S ribosomal protein L6 [Sedimentisphaerales bacterium]|nr:50S ribosomal protein L6 [Sedimentisphaerales bacterium]